MLQRGTYTPGEIINAITKGKIEPTEDFIMKDDDPQQVWSQLVLAIPTASHGKMSAELRHTLPAQGENVQSFRYYDVLELISHSTLEAR